MVTSPNAQLGQRLGFLLVIFASTQPAVAASAPEAPAAPAQQTQDDESRSRQEITETVTVTATRLPVEIADLPTAVTVWTGESLQRVPAVVLDDALRWSPKVSLFRRSSSAYAHPTSQGLNLRGVAPSGVSRALVLVDGVPMNDPFGGWVYWDRVPLVAVQRVEGAAGGGSAPYGNQALGGVVQFVTRGPSGNWLQLQALGGGDSTVRFGLGVGTTSQTVGFVAAAEVFDTAGYIATAPEQRGAVDTKVNSSHQSVNLRFDVRSQATFVIEALNERRSNGTPLQKNDTSLGGINARWHGAPGSAVRGWNVHAYARSQMFESSFSSVAPDRNSERLVLTQRVPSTDFGIGGIGWLPLGRRAAMSFGGDWRRVAGHSKERVVAIDLRRAPGGRQHLAGGFAALDWNPSDPWSLDLSVRVDGWHNTPVETPGEPRGAATLSPRAGFRWHVHRTTALRAAVYRAFRAPTLNELYRQFRVGNTLTLANSDLEEERLWGAEIGASITETLGETEAVDLTLEATFYWNDLDNAIINATERITPNLVFRRRQNLGAATIRGLELDGRLDFADTWWLRAAFSWLDARIESGLPAADPIALQPALEDNRLPQVPDYRARGTVGYRSPRGWSALFSVDAVGEQFEDDLNLLPLAAAVTVDAATELPLVEGVLLTLRAENLFDGDVEVRRTPTLALGPPRLVYGGVTISLPTPRR